MSALTCTSIKEVGGTTGRVGILFSGGLDSSAIAAAAQNLGLKTYLYTGVFEDSRFAISIERSADALGMDLKLEVVPEDSVEDALGHVIWAIESSDPLQVCVALPLNVAVKAAVRNGEDVLLSGSGADELFGGYSRYLDILRCSGENGLRNAMFGDLLRLGEADLLRDGTIGETNRIHLFAPFLNLNLVNLALSFPIAYRVTEPADRMRKHVLRLAAQRLGVPVEVTCLPKKAAQYSSGSLKMVRRLAKAYGLGIREYLDSIFMKVFDGLIPT